MAENPKNISGAKRNLRNREHFISTCKESRIVVEVHLSPRISMMYRKHFDNFSRALFLLRRYSRQVRESGVEERLTKEIMSLIEDFNEVINKKIRVADTIIKKEKITTKKCNYDVRNATIIDPIANQLLKTFALAQEFEDKIGSLWLGCFMDDSQRTKALSDLDSEFKDIKEKAITISKGVKDRYYAQNSFQDNTSNAEVIEDVLSTEDLATNEEDILENTTAKKGKKADKKVDSAAESEKELDELDFAKSAELSEEMVE